MVKVLVVDDEIEARKELVEFLKKRLDCHFFQADDGYQALELLKQTQIEVMILDLRMPGLSGRDVLKQAKELNSSLHTIVLSSWDSEEITREVEKAGAQYIYKPAASLDFIKDQVQKYLP